MNLLLLPPDIAGGDIVSTEGDGRPRSDQAEASADDMSGDGVGGGSGNCGVQYATVQDCRNAPPVAE
jgi:hypothetical protein